MSLYKGGGMEIIITKLNKLINKYSNPCMFFSGGLILFAFAIQHLGIIQIDSAVKYLYLTAFILNIIPILFRAIQAAIFKTVSIELLVSIASIAALFISEFNESAIVTFLFQFGSYLEQKTIKKTRSSIKALTEMAPTTAFKVVGDTIEETDADEIEIGDTLLVKTGNQIAADGVVIKGEGYVMEASITGESVPKYKACEDTVHAGTFLDSGTLYMQTTKVGEDTTFSKIIALVEEAQDAKSPIERFIDKFAKYYTPAVLLIAIAVLLITRNIDTAITVLVLACPGALVIGAPIANVAGIGSGAQRGILLKGGESIHTFSKTDTVVFDKTGTLTIGSPRVVDSICYDSDEKHVLALTASAERMTEHPLARAVTEYAGDIVYTDFSSAESLKGLGTICKNDETEVIVGSTKLMEKCGVSLSQRVKDDILKMQNDGDTTVLSAVNGNISMLLGIADALKDDAAYAVAGLRKVGISRIVMLTGDNVKTAETVSNKLGITGFEAELLPQDKLDTITRMKQEGHVVTFVGDGINDSPALTVADTGIAMGSGTDVAIDCSDVVLIKSDLKSLVRAIKLAKKTVRILYENIFIAIATVILLLAGLFAGYIHMSIGMLIHEASILVVIVNAMRLLIFNRRNNE